MIIEVCERLMDEWHVGHIRLPKYHACLAHRLSVWSHGRSVEEALDSLIAAHPDEFPNGINGFTVNYIGRRTR